MELRALVLAATLWLPSFHAAAESVPLDGHYYLHGAMEMGAELLLRKDGTFAGGIAYGSAGGMAKGTWYADGAHVTLTTDAASQPLKELQFTARHRHELSELEGLLPNAKFYEPVRLNHVVQMVYTREVKIPDPGPVYTILEFAHGPSKEVLLSAAEDGDFWLPFDPQRTLKKIGFGTSKNPEEMKWHDISPTTRSLTLWWNKPKNQPVSIQTPEELSLVVAQGYFRNAPALSERLQNYYLISLVHDRIPPQIKPVDLYWQFKEGATRQTVWADSTQSLLTLPFDATRTLQRVGMRSQGSPSAIQWFDVAPSERWLKLGWDAVRNESDNNLGVLFEDLQLAIEPNCLAVNFGSGKACFRR